MKKLLKILLNKSIIGPAFNFFWRMFAIYSDDCAMGGLKG